MKFSIDSFLKGRELSPQRKRVLAIGFIACIVLLFASFLLSLTEGEKDSQNNVASAIAQPELNTNLTQNTEPSLGTDASGQTGTLQIPSAQRYDFAQGQNQGTPGLENLLNDNAPIGENNDPFANMNGSRDAVNQSAQQQAQAPAAAPTQEAPAQEAPATSANVPSHTLYCDSFSSAQEAESQKAVLAFQGIVATVVLNQNGSYSLRLGPYGSDDEARSTFYQLNEKGVVQSCALY